MVWENKRFITLEGAGTSDGIGIGRAVPVENALPVVKREYVEDTAAELLRLQAAQETCIHEIELLAEETEVKAGRQVAAIVRSHKALLADPALNGEITRMISTEKCSCEWAVETVCVRYRQMFELMEDELMRQRAADLDDIRIRLLMALTGSTARGLSLLPEGSVIVAKELTPSMTASMDSSKVVGILTEVGGVNSHAAILARALEIPAVSGVPDVMDHIKTGEEIIVDGFGGKAYVSPDGSTRERFERRRDELQQEKQALFEYRNRRAVTRDGRDVTEAYRRGAEAAAQLARLTGAQAAVLKERSPSCGSGAVYDGTFSGTLTEGWGVTAALLRQQGLRVVGESGIAALLAEDVR